MLKINYILLLIPFLLSCSTNKNKYNDIELMSYHWSSYHHPKPYLQVHIYAIIDQSGEAKICVHKVYPVPGIDYLKIKVDRSLIDKVINSSDVFLNDTNMSYKKITKNMMDQASIKLRINQNKSVKTINFINDNYIPGIYNFMKLFNAIDSVYMSGKYDKLQDTLDLSNRREVFIKFAMKIDTTLIPPLLPPTAEVEKKLKFRNPINKNK